MQAGSSGFAVQKIVAQLHAQQGDLVSPAWLCLSSWVLLLPHL